MVFFKFSNRFSTFFLRSLLVFGFGNRLFAETIYVTSTEGGSSVCGMGDGTLCAAILAAEDGDVIDCSFIAGQIIGLTGPLSAIGYDFTPSSTLTILGRGVYIDGGSEHTAFSIIQGSVAISDFIIQNCNSVGGAGGAGYAGAGGGTGGGGAIYIHTGSTMTITAISLNDNIATGGAGGEGVSTYGGAGAGGGGYGGGAGGSATNTGSNAGAAGGGGGNAGGTRGGNDGAGGNYNTFQNFAGAGGGGARPLPSDGRNGGTTASIPSTGGGAGGSSTSEYAGGGGGGGGAGGSGQGGGAASESSGGYGGNGGIGFGVNMDYGTGGGGGGGGTGGTSGNNECSGYGCGTGGGGGGLIATGGAGGVLGGGGGASVSSSGGNSGFGAGGGAGTEGGVDAYSLGGAGGAIASKPAGGGGGSGLGGAIFIQKGGLLIVEDGNSFSGNMAIPGLGGAAESGGNAGGNGSSLGNDIFIRSGGSVTFQVNGALTLSNPIDGGGSLLDVTGPALAMSGSGIVNLSGPNTYLGATQIQSGNLNLNGSVIGDVQIEAGGSFSGNATVGGSLYNSGTLAPGNSIGTMNTTDLYLYSTSVYDVEVNSAGDSDEIIASGSAQLAGSVVITPDDFNFTTPLTYTIISASDGVTGAFSSLTSAVPSLVRLVYNSLNVQITYFPLEVVALSGNALNAASCFSTLSAIPGSDVATINNALFALNYGQLQSAFDQMGPAQFSALTEIQLLDAILVRSTYTKHLAEYCVKKDPSCNQSIGLWIDGIGQWQKQTKTGSKVGYRDTTYGGTIGLDYSFRSWILGLAFSATHDQAKIQSLGGKGAIHSYYGGLYGRMKRNGYSLNASVLGAQNNYRGTRKINFGDIDRQAHSKHKGADWLINLGFRYPICKPNFEWTPYINLDYVLQHEQSYTETGADSLDLRVKAKDASLFQGETGILFSGAYHAWNGLFLPKLTLAYINQTPCSNKNAHASFAGSSCFFAGKGGDYERNLFAPRLALTYRSNCDQVNFSLYYDSEIGSRYWAQDIGFDLSLRF